LDPTPSGILVSRNVHDQVRDKLSFGFEDMGEQTINNIARPIGVHRISLGESVASTTIKSAAVGTKTELPTANRTAIREVILLLVPAHVGKRQYSNRRISEDIITGLSKLRWFCVIARNSSFTYKGKVVDVKRVSRELGVRYVLEGSLRKGGSRAHRNHIWADRYDGDMTDVFALQDEITKKVIADEAHRALDRLKELQPDISRGWIEQNSPYAPGPMTKLLDGMRKAGLE